MRIAVHGLILQCHSESPELLDCLVRPFKFFKTETGIPSVEIYIVRNEPPYDSFPSVKSSFSTPRNVVFGNDELKIIDYFGNGVVLSENKGRKFTIYGREVNFLQEAFYLLVLSIFGQYCDEKGILRVHALTFSYNDTAVVFSAQSGAGKSTMAFALLDGGKFKLISDDEALIDASGHVLPFPIRIGTLDREKLNSIPEQYVYKIDRMEFGEKYFVDIDYWNERLERRHLHKKIFFFAQRLINGEPYIKKANFTKTLNRLFGAAVIGFGLYQGMEFVFNSSPRELISRVPVTLRRLRSAVNLSIGTNSYEIYLSRDSVKNYALLENFIDSMIAPS